MTTDPSPVSPSIRPAHRPADDARLRFAHEDSNLLGWTGLLISGTAYYLVPRFAGVPSRWPHLPAARLLLLPVGTSGSAVALAMRGYRRAVTPWLVAATIASGAFFVFVPVVAGASFRRLRGVHAKSVPIQSSRLTPAPMHIRARP
jgi:hypothetical protein